MTRSHPLTPMQRTMVLQSLVHGTSGHYILQMTGRLEEEIVPDAFAQAWEDVVNRHDALRASFHWAGAADPRQVFAEQIDLPFEFLDLAAADPADAEAAWQAFLHEDRARPFHIDCAPLSRLTLARTGNATFRFCWTVHHALLDGRSLVVVLEEVFAVYGARMRGEPVDLPDPPPFAAYLDWLSTQDVARHESYFRSALSGLDLTRSLLFEGSPTGVPDEDEIRADLSREASIDLERLARESGVTIHTLVQTAWAAVLWRSQNDDGGVVFGTTRACRFAPVDRVRSIVGLLINTLPVCARFDETTTVADLASDLRRQGIELREHEHVPLAEISRWVGIGGAPFRSVIIGENFEFDDLFREKGPEWARRSFELIERSESLSLATRLGDHLHVVLEYDRSRVSSEAAVWMVDLLLELLSAMPSAADRPILSLVEAGAAWEAPTEGDAAERARAPGLSDEERTTILDVWNRTDAEFPLDRPVHERIAEQAARRPEALAVADSNGRMTYADLDRRANRLANRLRALGVGPEERVCVCMESSRELVVAYLGVLRAGGAYVPVDPSSPADRIAFQLEDSGAKAVLVREPRGDLFGAARLPVVAVSLDEDFLAGESEEPPRSGVGPGNLVYVIYTSGSTGTPKGVLIEHRNLLNLVGVYDTRLGITEDDRTAMMAGVAFDAAVVDIWPYLVRGASLHVPDPQTRIDPRRLVPWLIEQEIDVVFLPTALGEAAFREDWSRSPRLRACLVGGDKLHAAPARRMPFVLYNTYGPTECTVDSTWSVVPTGVDGVHAPPIGRPIENYRAYVVDPDSQPLPVGQKGELWIGGAGVARGYLNRPELSAEKFVADPFRDGPDDRVYRTGDLVCFRADGEIEFHGRIDDQVQIRGYRVEPGEVAVILNEHADVGAVAVLAREDTPGRVRLVAYVVSPKPSSEVLPSLRSFAEEKLPAYMVPAFVAIDEMPITLNGKVDRRALRPPEEYPGWRGETGLASPRDDVERRLVEIWCDVLDLGSVGIDESFFDLGGDSLSVVTLLVAVEKEFGAEVEVPELLRDPTIAGLGRIVRGEGSTAERPIIVSLQSEGAGAPFFCVAGAGGGCHWFGELSKLVRPDRPFLGLEPIGPAGRGHTIEGIAHGLVEAIRRIQPEGPYHLGGYSTGGMIAFEMAQQLRRSGEDIGLLALIEADGGRDYSTRAGQVLAFARNLVRMSPAHAARIVLDRAGFALGAMRQRLGQSADTKVVTSKLDARKHEDELALHSYVPRGYDGDVHVFACEERPMTATTDESYGWGDKVRGRVVSSVVPGNHYTMLGLPNVPVLARALQAALDESVGAASVDAAVGGQRNV